MANFSLILPATPLLTITEYVRSFCSVPAVVTEGFDVEHNGDDQEGKESDHVCPDVPGLCVNSEDRLEALGGRLELGSVALVKVLVVFHPLGKHVIRTCPPPMSIVRCMYLIKTGMGTNRNPKVQDNIQEKLLKIMSLFCLPKGSTYSE